MNPERLGNLLNEIDKRVGRLANSLGNPPEGSSNQTVSQQITMLRAEVRRQISKLDKLRSADVDRLEAIANDLRDAASNALPPNHSPVHPLHSIFTDQIGLANLISGLRIGLTLLGPEDMLDAVPGQKLAAFTFGFVDNVLTVTDQPLRPHQNEEQIALAALEEAIEQGEYVTSDLEKTNVSPRLRESFIRLQMALEARKNIIQIGSRTQLCNRLVNSELEELSGGQAGLLLGHIEAVFRALSQFREWRTYCENALSINMDPSAISTITGSARTLAQELRNAPEIDASVTEALETVREWVEEDKAPDKRDVLSLSRVLENIWSAVTRETLALGKEAASEGRKMAARAIVMILVGSAAVAAIPIIGKVPGAEWIQTAYTYFKNLDPSKAP